LLRRKQVDQGSLLVHLHLPGLSLQAPRAGRRLLPGLVLALGRLGVPGAGNAGGFVAVLQEVLLGALAFPVDLKITQLLPVDADLRLRRRLHPLHALCPVAEPPRLPVRAVAVPLQLLLADWYTMLAYLPGLLRRGFVLCDPA